MRGRGKALAVLDALREREQVAGRGRVPDSEVPPRQRQNINVLEEQGLVEVTWREDHAELSTFEGRAVRWNTLYAGAAVRELEAGELRFSPEFGSGLSRRCMSTATSTGGIPSSARTVPTVREEIRGGVDAVFPRPAQL